MASIQKFKKIMKKYSLSLWAVSKGLRTSSVHFALHGKMYTPRAILPPAECDWLNWSHDKVG